MGIPYVREQHLHISQYISPEFIPLSAGGVGGLSHRAYSKEHFGNTYAQPFVFKTFIYYKYHKTQPNHDKKTVKSVARSIKTEPKRTKMVISYTGNRNFRASGKKRYRMIPNDTKQPAPLRRGYKTVMGRDVISSDFCPLKLNSLTSNHTSTIWKN